MPETIQEWEAKARPLAEVAPYTLVERNSAHYFDFGGAKVVLGDAWIDEGTREQAFSNGTLSRGTLVLGPKLRGTIVFTQMTLESLHIRCLAEGGASLTFQNCHIADVSLAHVAQAHFDHCGRVQIPSGDIKVLKFSECGEVTAAEPLNCPNLEQLTILGGGQSRTSISDISLDSKRALKVHLVKCNGLNFRLSGRVGSATLKQCEFANSAFVCKARDWNEEDCTHTASKIRGGEWRPNISGELVLANVKFENVAVNTEVISARCSNRQHIDLQKAIVNDAWEVLRDNYTGTLLAFHLLFLVAFVAPLLAKLAVLASLGNAGVALEGSLPGGLPVEWRTVYVGEILLFGFQGTDSLIGLVHAGLTLVLIAYNLIRVYLTYTVSKLRSREEHLNELGFILTRPDRPKYACLHKMHRWMKLLFRIALISSLWKLAEAAFIAVRIPEW